jgi:hypothetical protein
MNILYGHGPRPLALSATRRYQPEEILHMVDCIRAAGQTIFLQVENHNIPIRPNEFELASAVVAAYHNQIAYNAPQDDDEPMPTYPGPRWRGRSPVEEGDP